jgi:hypothetical protein
MVVPGEMILMINDPIFGVVAAPSTNTLFPLGAREYVVPDSVTAEPGRIVWLPMRNSSSVEGGTTNDPILGVVRTPLTKIFPPEDASEYVVPDSVAAEPGLIVWVPMRNSVAVGAVCDGKLSLGSG